MKCASCQEDKLPKDFHRRSKATNRQRQTWCKACRREYDREYHKGRRESGKKQEELEARLARNRQLLIGWLLAHPCQDCGEADPIVLEFDHQGEKKANVSDMVRWASTKTLQEEINVCEVVCANCHRRRTAKEQSWWINTRV